MVYLVFMKKTMVFGFFQKNHGFCQPWLRDAARPYILVFCCTHTSELSAGIKQMVLPESIHERASVPLLQIQLVGILHVHEWVEFGLRIVDFSLQLRNAMICYFDFPLKFRNNVYWTGILNCIYNSITISPVTQNYYSIRNL